MSNFYRYLENHTPTGIKRIIPQSWRIWLGHQIKVKRGFSSYISERLARPLSLPPGETEKTLRAYLASYQPEDRAGQEDELRAYLDEAFRRFLYTLELVPDGEGKLLEIGSNPFYMTLLLQKLRRYEAHGTNYFGSGFEHITSQNLVGPAGVLPMTFDNVNIETTTLPYGDETFDVALLCEVLEHFTNDPMHALLELRRVLKPGGHLILTTPNVNRLTNVARMISGNNLYDPYSGYGPYGRHNREYNRHEVHRLLEYLGYAIEESFTSDVHPNDTHYYGDPERVFQLVGHRQDDLGQYIFVRAVKRGSVRPPTKKPNWLYRNYPPDELGE